ncbi:MAG: GeoRSP system radical SAM/SPASM protein [Geobacter sp.]|nr:MAG: GeoRSP system radical SAM/SPASM protein [Geobacter sp.]
MGHEWLIKAPLTINWALNNSCNFACRHCYSRVENVEELDGDTLRGCFERVAKMGVMAVNFGGGEPLLREDLLELAAYAASLKLRVSMNSNGYLLDRDKAVALKQAGFAGVGISLDSHEAPVHDRFRGIEGSHARAVAALGYLRAAGIKTSLSTVICTINQHALDELVAFALEHGVSRLNLHNFKCAGHGLANKDELDLTPAQWQAFYRRALVVKERIKGLEISFDDPVIASLGLPTESSLVKGSVCGKLSLAIKSNGDITPCGFIPVVIGNIVRDDLGEIWRNSPLLAKMRHKEPHGKCGSCNHYADCLGGCSARALAMTGDINSPDPHCWVEP